MHANSKLFFFLYYVLKYWDQFRLYFRDWILLFSAAMQTKIESSCSCTNILAQYVWYMSTQICTIHFRYIIFCFLVFSFSHSIMCVVILELISSKEENNEFKDYRFFQVINLIQSDIKHSFTYYLFHSIKVILTLKI